MTVMLIRRLAKDLAAADYDRTRVRGSERFGKFWPNEKTFVGRTWPSYITEARATLSQMLGRTDIPEYQKEEIYEALLEDRDRTLKGQSAKVGRGLLKLRPDEPGTLERRLFHQ